MIDWKSLDLKKNQKRVVVAMSGGVDSSVAAAMLCDAGFEVIGVTLKLYDAPSAKRVGSCCAGIDIYDAAEVAQRMSFPHYVFDYASQFKEAVIDDFLESYLRGETPLPCVRCNQSVKFKDLLKASKELKADALVTGHYVQRVNVAGRIEMHRAVDITKDQSYFLFSTTKEQLEMLRFPLGGLLKKDIRKKAEYYNLPVADKPDSQDICFVGGGRYSDVILRMRPEANIPGLIRCAETNKPLGEHHGIIHFTVGQRKGLNLSHNPYGGVPLYVVRLDVATHTVYVGKPHLLKKKKIYVEDVNWLGDDHDTQGAIQVAIRSTQEPVGATVYKKGKTAIIILDREESSVALGQACVFYNQNVLLGGGWIKKVSDSD